AIPPAAAQLAGHAADLRDGFRAPLPRAVDAVARRLVGAAYREDLAGLRESGRLEALTAGATRHGFDRAEGALARNPARIPTHLPARRATAPPSAQTPPAPPSPSRSPPPASPTPPPREPSEPVPPREPPNA